MNHAKIVTRFAPSPTGFLHIGGARTALYSYYFAKHHGGTFRLRVEDTDKKRSTPEATQAILDGMDWLGIQHDGDIVYQSKNEGRHRDVAEALIASGHAYHCYLSAEQQAAERQASRDEGRAFRSPYRDEMSAPEDTPFVVRFRVPDGETFIEDAVLGRVKWQNKDFDDLILLRADGSPVYMLAVVVDDHDMGVTHVIRGDDHLVNGGRQKQIYQALGWDVPVFAHIPLIFGPDGKKLSKRHGALGVDAYEGMGYIPAGLRNYLTRLGWGHGDMEVFTDEELIKVFTLGGINKSPSQLDFDKMAYINGQHMSKTDTKTLFAYARPFFEEQNGGELSESQVNSLENALPSLVGRAKTLIALAEQTHFLTRKRPIPLTGKAKKPLKPESEHRLRDLQNRLSSLEHSDWSTESIGNQLNLYVQEQDIGFGKIGPALRACLTGGSPSPDLALVLDLLGKNETLARIQDCLDIFYDKNTHTQS